MIEIVDLYKSFGKKRVLNGITVNIPDNQTMCVIGKSGCGKSVLLKHIVGLLEPDIGKVLVDGKEISLLEKKDLFELRRKIGFVFQGSALFDSYTVYENIVIGLYEHGIRDTDYLCKEAKKVLSAVGLLPDLDEIESATFENEWNILKDKKPSDLSGGMKKRVGVARALVGDKNYVLYDEPTTGLDPVTSEQIDNLILDLARKFQITSLVITHDMFSVYKIADKVAMIDHGDLAFAGTPKELKESSNPIVREFLERYEENS